MITDCEHNIISDFAAREQCCKVLAFDSHKRDTLSMRKHIESCGSSAAAAELFENSQSLCG